MTWLDKLERKFGRYAIPNVTRLMVASSIVSYAVYFLAVYTSLNPITWIRFDPSAILHGQIWRLLSWIFVPSSGFSFWTIIFVICLLSFGDSLERGLGSFRMTVYFLGGILLNDIGGLLIYLIFGIPIHLTTYYMLLSLYMMLGLFMLDAEVRLYFVIPIRMKWMVIVYFVMLGIDVFEYFSAGLAYGLYGASEILFAVVNLLFFVSACKRRVSYRQAAKQKARQQQYRQQARPAPTYSAGHTASMHKCCICGRTEITNPELTFRYCSKCSGNKEYCNDHLFTHTHN